MKIRPVGAELFYAEGQTEGRTDRHDDVTVAFSNFATHAQKRTFLPHHIERLLMRMADKAGASLFLPIGNGTAHRHICRR